MTFMDVSFNDDPNQFAISQNYPNPFNPNTTIRYDINKSDKINMSAYDVSGRLVDVLIDEFHTPGSYNFVWEAHDLPSGLYFIKLNNGKIVDQIQVMLVK